ncbi:tyrosine-type recombinase/integrase [Mycolicibacterium canariasense]|nr:tyrosine-type recombinase/integrase [Mycolicibacterium canariasense]
MDPSSKDESSQVRSQPNRGQTQTNSTPNVLQSRFWPAVRRANRLCDGDPVQPPLLKFHALRHTYASLCVAAGISPLHLSRFMGHAKVTTTLSIYTHRFDDDHAATMSALEAMSRPVDTPNVVPMRRR